MTDTQQQTQVPARTNSKAKVLCGYNQCSRVDPYSVRLDGRLPKSYYRHLQIDHNLVEHRAPSLKCTEVGCKNVIELEEGNSLSQSFLNHLKYQHHRTLTKDPEYRPGLPSRWEETFECCHICCTKIAPPIFFIIMFGMVLLTLVYILVAHKSVSQEVKQTFIDYTFGLINIKIPNYNVTGAIYTSFDKIYTLSHLWSQFSYWWNSTNSTTDDL